MKRAYFIIIVANITFQAIKALTNFLDGNPAMFVNIFALIPWVLLLEMNFHPIRHLKVMTGLWVTRRGQ